MQEAVISLLRAKRIKNPETIVNLAYNIYSHTNSKGNIHIFHVFTTNHSYKEAVSNSPHKLYKVNTFYIVEFN